MSVETKNESSAPYTLGELLAPHHVAVGDRKIIAGNSVVTCVTECGTTITSVTDTYPQGIISAATNSQDFVEKVSLAIYDISTEVYKANNIDHSDYGVRHQITKPTEPETI